MKFKFVFKIIALLTAFMSGVAFNNNTYLIAVIMGLISITSIITDSKQ